MPVLIAITRGERPVIDPHFDSELRAFIERGWNENPLERPKLSDFIELVRRKQSEPGAKILISLPSTNDIATPILDAVVTMVLVASNNEQSCQPVNHDYILHRVKLTYKVINRFLSRMSPVQIQAFRRKLENSLDDKPIILAPRDFTEESQGKLNNWLKSREDSYPFHEISVAEGDVLILTSPKSSQVCNYFQEFPFGNLQLKAPNYRLDALPPEKQMDSPKELNILMTGDSRLDLKSFCSCSFATYSRQVLGRLKESEDETRIPLNGIMNSFFVVKDGEGTLSQRFAETVDELVEVAVVCLFICMDFWRNMELFEILTAVQIEKIIIVGVCETIYFEQARKKLATIYGEKATKSQVLFLKKADLFEKKNAEHLEAVGKVIDECIDRARRFFYC